MVELGTDGRLLSLQLDELIGGVSPDRDLVVRDYLESTRRDRVDDRRASTRWPRSRRASWSTSARWRGCSGFSDGGDALDTAVSPKGYRLLTQDPAAAGDDRRAAGRPLRRPAEAARRQPRRPHARRGRRRAAGARRPRGPVAAGRVEHPGAVRLSTRSPRAACHRPRLVRRARARPALAARRTGRRGACWSARSCCSRRRSPGCCRSGGSGWRAGRRPADLAAEPPGEAVRAWGRLGYPRRALRLHAAATAIVERHGGEVPARPRRAAARCRGSASYTAAAVASFAFGQRHAVLDTNVRRVLARAVGGRAVPGAGAHRRRDARRGRACCRTTPAARRRWARRGDGARRAGLHGAGAALRRLPGARAGARGGWPARRRTTGRRGAARRGPAPTGRCAAG